MAAAPDRKVVYLTAERFLTGFVRAADGPADSARSRTSCASADLLLIDDVHFIGGKQSTQEELFHTLAALMEDGRRVVFSADRPPSALTEIDARLRSHLSAGPGLRHRAGRPGPAAGHPGAQARDAARASQGFSGGRGPRCWSSWPTASPTASANWKGALNTLVVRAGSAVCALTLDEAQSPAAPAPARRRAAGDRGRHPEGRRPNTSASSRPT